MVRTGEIVAHVAEAWGADWEPLDEDSGRLRIPIVAGLRRGVGEFELRLVAVPEGTRIDSIARGEELHLQRSSLVLLAAGGLGALTLLAWPFFPGFLVLAPIGIVAALAAWLVVIQRLRNSGVEEFLEEVRQVAGE